MHFGLFGLRKTTARFKVTAAGLQLCLQSGGGKKRGGNLKGSAVHTGDVPELGRPSCACCLGRGWGLQAREEGVT